MKWNKKLAAGSIAAAIILSGGAAYGLQSTYAADDGTSAQTSPAPSATPGKQADGKQGRMQHPGNFGGKEGARGGGGIGYIGDARSWLATAATTLGLEQDALRQELAGGKSLADIAAEKGDASDTLTAALTADATKRIDEQAAAGKLTAEQAAQAKEKVAAEVGKLIEQKGLNGKGGKGGPGDRGGFGIGGGKGGHGAGGLPVANDKLATILGISQDDLAAALKEGKSLSDIAGEHGISKDQLVGSIKDNLTDWIGQMVDRKHEPRTDKQDAGKQGAARQAPAASGTQTQS
ncbi:MAG: hypothetical protein J7639_18280 [Paenibacillaceae bacterium]|nr:hypothetical protein [Paenibacillaceae bacterium]